MADTKQPTGLKPCPFCGSEDIHTQHLDDDSWKKTLVAKCGGCGASIESSLDWKPFADKRDNAGWDAAWKEKIAEAWNHRAALAAQAVPDQDGEAFRLAARLGLTLRFYGGCAQSSVPGTPCAYEVVEGTDRAAAMREAVSKASDTIAAQWGRQVQASATAEAPSTDIDEAALARMTEQGAKAWAGVDAQSLRDGSYASQPQAAQPVAPLKAHPIADIICAWANGFRVEFRYRHTDNVEDSETVYLSDPKWHLCGSGYSAFSGVNEHRIHADDIAAWEAFKRNGAAAPALTEEQIEPALKQLMELADEYAGASACAVTATTSSDADTSVERQSLSEAIRAALRSTQGGE